MPAEKLIDGLDLPLDEIMAIQVVRTACDQCESLRGSKLSVLLVYCVPLSQITPPENQELKNSNLEQKLHP